MDDKRRHRPVVIGSSLPCLYGKVHLAKVSDRLQPRHFTPARLERGHLARLQPPNGLSGQDARAPACGYFVRGVKYPEVHLAKVSDRLQPRHFTPARLERGHLARLQPPNGLSGPEARAPDCGYSVRGVKYPG